MREMFSFITEQNSVSHEIFVITYRDIYSRLYSIISFKTYPTGIAETEDKAIFNDCDIFTSK